LFTSTLHCCPFVKTPKNNCEETLGQCDLERCPFLFGVLLLEFVRPRTGGSAGISLGKEWDGWRKLVEYPPVLGGKGSNLLTAPSDGLTSCRDSTVPQNSVEARRPSSLCPEIAMTSLAIANVSVFVFLKEWTSVIAQTILYWLPLASFWSAVEVHQWVSPERTGKGRGTWKLPLVLGSQVILAYLWARSLYQEKLGSVISPVVGRGAIAALVVLGIFGSSIRMVHHYRFRSNQITVTHEMLSFLANTAPASAVLHVYDPNHLFAGDISAFLREFYQRRDIAVDSLGASSNHPRAGDLVLMCRSVGKGHSSQWPVEVGRNSQEVAESRLGLRLSNIKDFEAEVPSIRFNPDAPLINLLLGLGVRFPTSVGPPVSQFYSFVEYKPQLTEWKVYSVDYSSLSGLSKY
jgi:hypothetical protein